MEPTSRLGVVIPVLNEAEHLPLLLEDLLGQDLEPERFVVMILDGGSVDQTEAMAREALVTAPFEVLHVANTERTVPYARNLAMELLPPDVELLVELIGHVRIPHDHLRLRLTSWQKAVESHGEGLAAVGVRVNGPDRVASATERWIDGALRSALGSGGGQFARFDRLESTKVPAFATHRRTAVASIGGWDVRWSTSQDSDLSMRLLKAGFVLLRDPSLTVNMARRSTLTSHWRMSVRYGYWRGRLLRRTAFRGPVVLAPLPDGACDGLVAHHRVRGVHWHCWRHRVDLKPTRRWVVWGPVGFVHAAYGVHLWAAAVLDWLGPHLERPLSIKREPLSGVGRGGAMVVRSEVGLAMLVIPPLVGLGLDAFVDPLNAMLNTAPWSRWLMYPTLLLLGVYLRKRTITERDHEHRRSTTLRGLEPLFRAEDQGLWDASSTVPQGERPNPSIGELVGSLTTEGTEQQTEAEVEVNTLLGARSSIEGDEIERSVGASTSTSPMDRFFDRIQKLLTGVDGEISRKERRKRALQARAEADPIRASRPVAPLPDALQPTSSDSSFATVVSSRVEPLTVGCTACGSQVDPAERFCTVCGADLS